MNDAAVHQQANYCNLLNPNAFTTPMVSIPLRCVYTYLPASGNSKPSCRSWISALFLVEMLKWMCHIWRKWDIGNPGGLPSFIELDHWTSFYLIALVTTRVPFGVPHRKSGWSKCVWCSLVGWKLMSLDITHSCLSNAKVGNPANLFDDVQQYSQLMYGSTLHSRWLLLSKVH